ncbi:ABC transporter ATP-binding protein [Halostella sp. JP-L12]|uniref:ABC transporter ATP-binding protein n=1 Tax=Halostella TaxID=1843185 RepID=UPI000EF7BD88|nr:MULTISPECIES: ABC transporter ATP-binding protein [Halostella]NHN46150.1 ABC transporter ATP-binding protein [Halostella sp. JP-L12]
MSKPAYEQQETTATDRTGETLVEVNDLKTYYGSEGGLLGGKPVKAVDGVSFSIEKGETLGLVGESGCGKTTLGRTLMQLESATSGEVTYAGTDITTLDGKELKQWRQNVQMVFQDPDSSLNNRMTIGEIVREPLDVHDWPTFEVGVQGVDAESVTVEGEMVRHVSEAKYEDSDLVVTRDAEIVHLRESAAVDSSELTINVAERGDDLEVEVTVHKSKAQLRRRRVRSLLETVGLQEEHYYRYPHQFSGGQQQRIGIARALALEPDFVVLDEPVSALDASVQAKILNLLEDLQDEFGLTYLFIAHDLSVVRHICDRVAVMYLGNIMELGETEELFTDPANPYTHSLLSAIPEPDPTLEKDRITLRGTPPSPRDPPTGCPFTTRCPMKIRPEKYRGIDEELWTAIEVFREVLRERVRAERTTTERIKEFLDMDTRFASIDEITEELFGDLDVPAEVETHVSEAASRVADGDEESARDYLAEEFGSICDGEFPDAHEVSASGRRSRCHRHREEFAEPDAFREQTSD